MCIEMAKASSKTLKTPKTSTKTSAKTNRKTSKSKTKTPKPASTTPASEATTCVVNDFLTAIDKELSVKIASDIPCKDVYKLIEKSANKFPDVPDKLLEAASKMITKGIECRGDIVANVNEVRRIIVRIQCIPSDSGDEVKLKLKKEPQNEPPLPKGFVQPRNWDPEWTTEWAKEHGWILDPYYDWLMPSAQVEDTKDDDKPKKGGSKAGKKSQKKTPKKPKAAGTKGPSADAPAAPAPAVEKPKPEVKKPDAPKPTPAAQTPTPQTPESQPKPTEQTTTDEAEEESDGIVSRLLKNKWFKWGLIAIVALCLAFVGYRVIKSRSGDGSSLGASQVDQAFDTSAPPTSMMPNTTELMNDLESSPKKGRGRGRKSPKVESFENESE
jgi:hypothetical protein